MEEDQNNNYIKYQEERTKIQNYNNPLILVKSIAFKMKNMNLKSNIFKFDFEKKLTTNIIVYIHF